MKNSRNAHAKNYTDGTLACCGAGVSRNPPRAKRYRVRIDDNHYTVEKSSITGRELLVIAGKNPPENFILTQKTRGSGVKTIGLNDTVDLTEPGIERFNTLPRQVQEG